MEKRLVPSPAHRVESERPGPCTSRAVADAAFLVQLAGHGRLRFLPFALQELDAWAVLFLAIAPPDALKGHDSPSQHRRAEILGDLVPALLAADSWSRAYQVPVLTCPADERVAHLFEARGLSDCLFIPVAAFLERLERLFRVVSARILSRTSGSFPNESRHRSGRPTNRAGARRPSRRRRACPTRRGAKPRWRASSAPSTSRDVNCERGFARVASGSRS